jgi:hypothetical protein
MQSKESLRLGTRLLHSCILAILVLVVASCDDDGGQQIPCKSDSDCPEQWRCVKETGFCTCIPDCDGKCCGTDGCEGTCTDTCPSGQECDMNTCFCTDTCTSDEDCWAYECCRGDLCVTSECRLDDCGIDAVCGFECGTCLSGEVCNAGKCSGGMGCKPICPEGSECRALDSLERPECVWPSGSLACTDDSHCPIIAMGYCGEDNSCHFGPCECSLDEECEPDTFCRTWSRDCGRCAYRDNFTCENDNDCVVAAMVGCCLYLTCGVIDCMPEQHCWPLPEQTPVTLCVNGACRLDPPPFP